MSGQYKPNLSVEIPSKARRELNDDPKNRKGQYKCTLSEETLSKAIRELNEDPDNRNGAIQALQKWIKEQEYLTFPLDCRIVLMFLRHAKFSQLKARQTVEKFCQAKSLHQDVFSNLDPFDENFIRFIKTGTWVMLPGRCADGSIRLINRAGGYKPSEWKTQKVHWFRAVYLFWHYIAFDEENQVHGYSFLADFTNFSMAHKTFFTMEEMKGLLKRFQNAFPLRYKGLHHYNCGTMFEAMFTIMHPFMDKKFRERVIMHGNNLEKVYNEFPMDCLPAEYLPDDYDGPTAGTIDELTDKMLRDMQRPEVVEYLKVISNPNWGYDATLKPETTDNTSFRFLKWS